ncbi:MAG: hypothetical protein K6F71_10265 [Ruminococcus sp.]|uniref:hypothetical protein n=1 Tax=Ruminococcus sp. TaxID=41978 RepID=UPI0025DE2825|nr:hypothetical protein [Ruminococcus sp.]MCR5541183.1 hypothetical protein [Ruminococcus sp.]
MVDMEKVKTLISMLEERSGLDVREAVARSFFYLNSYELTTYRKKIDYLLETFGVEEEPTF